MKKQIILLVLGIFMINFVLGVSVCIDKDAPTWQENSSLDLSVVDENNVKLVWDEADDKPECSNISHYDIFKNNSYLTSVNSTSYIDNNTAEGESYEYVVYPVDLGDNEGNGISGLTSLEGEEDDNGGGSGGGGISSSSTSSSTTSVWECGKWSECDNGTQRRECEDLTEYSEDRVETRECIRDESLDSGDSDNQTEANFSDENTSEETDSQDISGNFFQRLTGAVIGEKNQGKTLAYIGIVLVVLVLGIFLIRKLKN